MKRPVGQLIVLLWGQQFGLLFLVAGCLWVFDPFATNGVTAYSVLIGGFIFWIPNAYFTLYAFRHRGAQAALAVLQSMIRGEFGKFLLTATAFALAFVFVKPLSYPAVFTAYLVMILSQWLLISRWP